VRAPTPPAKMLPKIPPLTATSQNLVVKYEDHPFGNGAAFESTARKAREYRVEEVAVLPV
jgi:hypothetical protein